MRVIALITARGGSKGLKRKNVHDFLGFPLIYWTIEAAKKSENIDEIYVSTEDEEIKQVSEKYGATVIKRPLELASDTASSHVVIEHFIKKLPSVESDVVIVLLQPTSPLRSSEDINGAIRIFQQENANAVVSVYEPSQHPAKLIKSVILDR